MFLEMVEAGATIWEHRGAILGIFDSIVARVKYGSLQLVVFGPGGAGKSTLGKFLQGKVDGLGKYDESLDTEEYKLKSDLWCTILVPPGQKRRREAIPFWDTLYENLRKGVATGVINVSAWGFHSFDAEHSKIGYRKHKIFAELAEEQAAASKQLTSAGATRKARKGKPKGKKAKPGTLAPSTTPATALSENTEPTKQQFLERYLERKRDEEIGVIQELVKPLIQAKGRLWMISLIAKQDLWWTDRETVRRHYVEGAYSKEVNKITEKHAGFLHEYWSTSFVRENFKDGEGVELSPVAAGYEDGIKHANLHKFVKMVEDLSKAVSAHA